MPRLDRRDAAGRIFGHSIGRHRRRHQGLGGRHEPGKAHRRRLREQPFIHGRGGLVAMRVHEMSESLLSSAEACAAALAC